MINRIIRNAFLMMMIVGFAFAVHETNPHLAAEIQASELSEMQILLRLMGQMIGITSLGVIAVIAMRILFLRRAMHVLSTIAVTVMQGTLIVVMVSTLIYVIGTDFDISDVPDVTLGVFVLSLGLTFLIIATIEALANKVFSMGEVEKVKRDGSYNSDTMRFQNDVRLQSDGIQNDVTPHQNDVMVSKRLQAE